MQTAAAGGRGAGGGGGGHSPAPARDESLRKAGAPDLEDRRKEIEEGKGKGRATEEGGSWRATADCCSPDLKVCA